MKRYSLLMAILCGMGLLWAVSRETAQGKPGFGVSCSSCHTTPRNGMVIVDYDTLTNLGQGDRKTFTVEAGKSVSLSLNVTDGHDKYAVVLKDLEKKGVQVNNMDQLVFTPDAGWVNYSSMNPPYYASTSSRHEWSGVTKPYSFTLQVDSSTPSDFYALRFELAGKSGGRWSQQEEFYLHVLPAAPVSGNGDIDGDGDVNMCDFSLLASNWLNSGCSPENSYCSKADINLDGVVDFNDLYVLAENWLIGKRQPDAGAVEDFETGNLSRFPWEVNTDAGWFVTSSVYHSGMFGAQASPINHNENATLRIKLHCISGDIRFFRKVSSESGLDCLRFYIDGVEENKWSGEEDWAEMTFPVNEGIRTFEWIYTKDDSVSEGDDTAWIDDVTFPIDARF